MSYDVPTEETRGRRWCESCRLSVEPVAGDRGPECPSCGESL